MIANIVIPMKMGIQRWKCPLQAGAYWIPDRVGNDSALLAMTDCGKDTRAYDTRFDIEKAK